VAAGYPAAICFCCLSWSVSSLHKFGSMTKAPTNLAGLLTDLAKAGRQAKRPSVRDIREIVGKRSFAPLLLATSIIGFTPVGGVPGMPTTLALLIVLIAAQIVLGFKTVWLPKFLLDRRIEGRKLEKGAKSMLPFARTVDRFIGPRLTFLTERPASYAIALASIMIAVTVPPLELVPLVDMPLWAALVAFSLALATHDGVLAIAALALTGVGVILVAMAVL
jgi:hypothetical protein